jgi:ABC-type antimicrobial peptide transport system permease subunit
MYFPFVGAQFVVLKTRGAAGPLAATLERTLHGADADLAISDVRTMEQIVAESTRTRRLTMTLLASFAGLALVLALAGIYGVMSWWVAQRTREVGIRMALGAQQGEVVRMVLMRGMKLTAAGLALGIGASMLLRWALAGLVYGVSASDPATYVAVTAAMLAVAAAACYLPARRACGVDPMVALREE